MQSSLIEFTIGDSLDVASNREKMDEIIGRLDKVEIELGIRPKTKGWWAKQWEYIKTHKATIIPLAALILIIPGWFVSGWFKYYLDHKDEAFNNAVDGRITAKLIPVQAKLQEIDVKLATIGAHVSDLLLQRSATQPINSQSAIQVAQVLKSARNNGEKLDSELITDAGKKFIDTKQVPQAWDTALAFIGYKSFLNASDSKVTTLQGWPRTLTTRYFLSWVDDKRPVVSHNGPVPAAQAAKMNPIGQNLNTSLEEGDRLIRVDGGAPILDGMEMKNVVFVSSHIVYKGGPTILENVVFVNCTFEIAQQSNGQRLATAILVGKPDANINLS